MASATTVNGTQAIKTLNNLNMEGKFKENSLKQFSNLNTAVITYTSTLENANVGDKLQLYDSISESVIQFELVGQDPNILQNQFLRDNSADVTAQNLTDRINDITLQGTATNNHYSAIIEYFDALNNATADDAITLYNYQTAVVFTMVNSTPATPTAIQFRKGIDADATATNLSTAINNHSAFSAILDKYSTTNEGRIIITQISSSGKPTNNIAPTGFLSTELSVTNFSNFSATIDDSSGDGGTITVTQNTSKSYGSNSKTGFTDAELSVTDFNVNSGDEAAIPSETIGTYQILNKVITDLSSLKKSIITRNKTLQKDVSNDYDNNVTLTSNLFSTHQSIITLDKSRGNLDQTTNSPSPTNQKPSVFESDTIKYSEDALFTLLKGLGYEIIKFNNNVNDSNNGGNYEDAGIAAIPISIQAHNNTNQTATLSNVTATIHNINRSDATINTSADTSAVSIPEGTNNSADGVGLIQLINAIINNITLIKRSIKTRELAILTALKLDINNLETSSINNMNVAVRDSKITTLKTRGGLLDDNVDNNNLHKPSIFSADDKHYSEDAVFSLFSCISYELMKLLKGHSGNNNGGGVLGAGLQTIPASIEIINQL